MMICRICVLAVCFLLVGCEDPRVPMTKGQVVAAADMKLEHGHLQWGTARSVIKPRVADASGRFFWIVQYADGADNQLRVVYVNEHSHWAHIRAGSPQQKVAVTGIAPRSAAIMHQLTMQEGSSILVLGVHAAENTDAGTDAEAAARMREVARLNTLAQDTGLVPMFSQRHLVTGDAHIIYGWNGSHGVQQQQNIMEWIHTRTAYADAYWLNLAPE